MCVAATAAAAAKKPTGALVRVSISIKRNFLLYFRMNIAVILMSHSVGQRKIDDAETL
jgi:hypothetical protein